MKIKKYNDFVLEKIISIEMRLPKDIIEISDAFIKAGKEIFVVGGAVRDFLQKKDPKDYDLVTNALPEESKKILNGFKVSDEQGKNFGVLRVYTKDEPKGYEVASYRKDIAHGRDTKGDDPKVEMGNHITIEDDCMRRDLTINALFYDIKKKEIVDIVGGVDDIKNGIIKAVGNPMERFIEDRLRICRIFRFAARINGKIDEKTIEAIKKDHRLRGIGPKEDVSQERIWEEMIKAFKQAKDYNYYLEFFTKFDMWNEVFPGSNINTNLVKSHDFIVIFANLFKNEDINTLGKKLKEYRIEDETAVKIIFLISLLNFNPDDVYNTYKRKYQSETKDSTILEWIKVNDIKDPLLIKFVDYKPTISAKELMDKGFKGKELGDKLKELETKKFKMIT